MIYAHLSGESRSFRSTAILAEPLVELFGDFLKQIVPSHRHRGDLVYVMPGCGCGVGGDSGETFTNPLLGLNRKSGEDNTF